MEDLYWGGAVMQPPSPRAGAAAAAATMAPSLPPPQPSTQTASPCGVSASAAINEQRRLRARAGVQAVMARMGLLSDDQVSAAMQEVERRQREPPLTRPGLRGRENSKTEAGPGSLKEEELQRKRASALSAASALGKSLPVGSLPAWVAWRDGLLPAALAPPANFNPGRLRAWAAESRADLERWERGNRHPLLAINCFCSLVCPWFFSPRPTNAAPFIV